jgi:hypothetical protein
MINYLFSYFSVINCNIDAVQSDTFLKLLVLDLPLLTYFQNYLFIYRFMDYVAMRSVSQYLVTA